MHKTIFISFFLLTLTMHIYGQEEKNLILSDSVMVKAILLCNETFNDDLLNWKVEQMPGGTVQVKTGKLEINDVAGCTVWFTQKLEAPAMIEYDAIVIKDDGPNDLVTDLNCFWMANDNQFPDNLFEKSTQREGKFRNYDSLNLYYVGLGGHYNSKTRFRRYTGDGNKPLLPEHDLSDSNYLITPNKLNQIRIIVFNGIIQYYRNDKLIFNFFDKEAYTKGYFGFRTVHNHMTVDNFKVYKLVIR